MQGQAQADTMQTQNSELNSSTASSGSDSDMSE